MTNDGKLIVYCRFREKENYYKEDQEIWIMNADGSDQELIIERGWSPSLWVR